MFFNLFPSHVLVSIKTASSFPDRPSSNCLNETQQHFVTIDTVTKYPAWLNHLHIIGGLEAVQSCGAKTPTISPTPSRPGRLNVVNILPVNNFFQATSNQSNIIYSVGLHSDSLNKIRNYSTWQRSFNCKISLKSYKMFLKNLNPIFCLLHTTSTVLPKCKHEYQYKYYWPGSGNAMSIIVGS